MTTEALTAAGLEPTGIAGGRVGAWNGNLSAAGDGLFVVEADEYDRSFLALTPDMAIITNVEADHLDMYTDLDDIRAAFGEFARRAKTLILCADDRRRKLGRAAPAPMCPLRPRRPLARRAARRAQMSRAERGGSVFSRVRRRGGGAVELRVPGLHNVLQRGGGARGGPRAAGGRGAACSPGWRGSAAWGGGSSGWERRAASMIVDDYAHHPTEVRRRSPRHGGVPRAAASWPSFSRTCFPVRRRTGSWARRWRRPTSSWSRRSIPRASSRCPA